MHKQKRKFNRIKIIGIIVLIISLLMSFVSGILLNLDKITPPIMIILIFFGIIGVFISTFIIVMPCTKNNEISKEILNYFEATHKD